MNEVIPPGPLAPTFYGPLRDYINFRRSQTIGQRDYWTMDRKTISLQTIGHRTWTIAHGTIYHEEKQISLGQYSGKLLF